MKETSVVREKLMNEPGYTPYCGSCDVMPRTRWDESKQQFTCPYCGWTSQFPYDFIVRYKRKWNK